MIEIDDRQFPTIDVREILHGADDVGNAFGSLQSLFDGFGRIVQDEVEIMFLAGGLERCDRLR